MSKTRKLSGVDLKIARAKTTLVLEQPFVASLLLQMEFLETDKVETAATDGRQIMYNPEFFDKLTEDEVVGVLAHEVWHVALLHPLRKEDRQHAKYNVACDLAVNPILKDDGFILPSFALDERKYHNMSVEEIYSKLPDPPEEDVAAGNMGVVVEPTGDQGQKLTSGQLKEIENDIKQQVIMAAETAKNAGKISAAMKRLVEDIVHPKEKWWDSLRKLLTQSVREGWSWMTPSRRYVGSGVYIPSRKSNRTGTIVCMVDTSGSVNDRQIRHYAGHLSSIIEDLRVNADVLYIDSAVCGHEHFNRNDFPLKMHPSGGGGTDFRPGFEWLRDNDIQPVCVVYFTDLWCDDYPPEPDFPVVWVTPEEERRHRGASVPFGEVVEIDWEDTM